MTRICDKDCLHCRFADCILEELDAEDYREARARDKELTYTPEQRQIAAYQRAYREANKKKRPTRRQPQSSARNNKPSLL